MPQLHPDPAFFLLTAGKNGPWKGHAQWETKCETHSETKWETKWETEWEKQWETMSGQAGTQSERQRGTQWETSWETKLGTSGRQSRRESERPSGRHSGRQGGTQARRQNEKWETQRETSGKSGQGQMSISSRRSNSCCSRSSSVVLVELVGVLVCPLCLSVCLPAVSHVEFGILTAVALQSWINSLEPCLGICSWQPILRNLFFGMRICAAPTCSEPLLWLKTPSLRRWGKTLEV